MSNFNISYLNYFARKDEFSQVSESIFVFVYNMKWNKVLMLPQFLLQFLQCTYIWSHWPDIYLSCVVGLFHGVLLLDLYVTFLVHDIMLLYSQQVMRCILYGPKSLELSIFTQKYCRQNCIQTKWSTTQWNHKPPIQPQRAISLT